MVSEREIASALREEARQARVPADDLLRRIKSRSSAPRSGMRWQGIAAAAVLVTLLGGVAVRELVRQSPTTPASAVQETQGAYENPELGIRLKSTAQLTGQPEFDGQGMVFRFSLGEIRVSRQPRRAASTLESLVQEAIDQNMSISSSRIVTVEQGTRELAGRPAGYLLAAYISAAAGRHQENYFLLTDNHEYAVTCGTVSGERTPWEQAKPLCDQILSGLELLEKP